MNVELKIAKRYIFPKGSFNFISIITLISILGIAIGVAALIIVMSIFNGFRDISESVILDFDPPIRIVSKNSAYINDYPQLVNKLQNYNSIKSIIPTLQTKAVIIYDTQIEIAEFIAQKTDSFTFAKNVVYGSSYIDDSEVVLGIGLANKLQATIYDTLKILSTKMLEHSFHTLQIPQGITVKSVGLFQGNAKEYDWTNFYGDFDIVRKITRTKENEVSYIDIITVDLEEKNIDKLAAELNKNFGNDFDILTWKDLNRDLYNIMQMERVAVFCVLSLILLIAVFNVFASLAMTVMEKKPEIAILKTIGCDNKFISKIYLFEGLLIGFIGTVFGLIIGLGLSVGQNTYKWLKIDTIYFVDAIPVIINNYDIAFICIFSLFLSFIATIYPVKKANQLNISQAIRSE